jgi:MFS family permease
VVAPDRRQLLRALWAASVLGGLGQALAGTAGSLLVRELGGSDAAAGLPQALLVVGTGGSALVLSAVTKRFGRGPALTSGALAALAGCVVIAFAGLGERIGWVLAGSVLLGAGNTAVMLGRYAAADLGPQSSRARAMASVLMATTFGAVAGPNLLAPAGAVADGLGLAPLVGPYLLSALAFAAAAAVLATGFGARRTGFVRAAPAAPTPAGGADIGRPPATAMDGARRPLGRAGGTGVVVLGATNLVMVGAMTMAPLQLHHLGAGLGMIGLVVSAHIAAMFAPSVVSGTLTDRFGPLPVAASAGVVLLLACAVAAAGAGSAVVLAVAMALLGLGWNLGLVSGSALLTVGVAEVDRPGREGWGEVGMSVAAAGGAAGSGLIMQVNGYGSLAIAAGAVAVVLLLCAVDGLHRAARTSGRRVP